MIKKVTLLDEAQLKLEMRRNYRELGYSAMIQIFYELITAARICAEVTKEELLNEEKEASET